MERLKTLDAEFLHIEDGTAHMHIAGACVFPNPPPAYDDVVALVAGKLHEMPRYRQRVRSVPFELGRPVWVDDPHFDLRYHLRHTALPAPGDDANFTRLMGRLMSQPLDRERPLWEAWLVEGLADDRWALICKIHHSMVDGIAGVQLLTALLDVVPDARPLEPQPWSPRPEPGALAKVVDAWSGLAADVAGSTRSLAGAIRHPARAFATTAATVRGLNRTVRNLRATPPLADVEGSIGPHRTWAHANASLTEVKTIGKTLGGTVNDVVVTAVAGSFRALLLARGIDPSTAVVRSLIPVSMRREDANGVPDNRVSMMLYELPVSVADPAERLVTVHAEMAEHKASSMIEAGEVVTTLGDLVPPMLVGPASRTLVGVFQRTSQRAINTVTTNVPGPQFRLYCLGSEMLEYRPFVPIMHGIRLATAILSYNGKLFFGVTGAYENAEDVDRLATGAATEIAVLHRVAAPPKRKSSKAPPRKTAGRQSGT